MNKNRFLLFLILFLLVILGSNMVFAATGNVLEPVLNTLESFRIAENYERYHIVVDCIIYLIIFIGVARQFLGERFGNGPAVGIGLIMALSLTGMEYRLGYSVTDFGLLAGIILAFVLGFFIYNLFSTNGTGGFTAFSIAFVLVFLLMQKMIIDLAIKYPTTYGIMMILVIVCVFRVGQAIFNSFGGGGGGGNPAGPAQAPNVGPAAAGGGGFPNPLNWWRNRQNRAQQQVQQQAQQQAQQLANTINQLVTAQENRWVLMQNICSNILRNAGPVQQLNPQTIVTLLYMFIDNPASVPFIQNNPVLTAQINAVAPRLQALRGEWERDFIALEQYMGQLQNLDVALRNRVLQILSRAII
jgi:hypothetical protein